MRETLLALRDARVAIRTLQQNCARYETELRDAVVRALAPLSPSYFFLFRSSTTAYLSIHVFSAPLSIRAPYSPDQGLLGIWDYDFDACGLRARVSYLPKEYPDLARIEHALRSAFGECAE